MTLISNTDPLVASLSAFGTLPDWLAAPMHGDRVGDSLARHVPDFATGRLALLSCDPQRLRAKGGEWIARYKLSVATSDGEPREVVLVGNLIPPSHDVDPSAVPAGAVSFGEEGFSCWLPDLRLQLRHEDSDEALPALPVLTDPRLTAELLQPIVRKAGYAGATIDSCNPVVVRYKPGSRCTVVVGVTYTGQSPANAPRTVVLKTHQGDKGATAWEAMTDLWQRPESWKGIVRLAEPLAFLPDERILVQGPVPEEVTLKELARNAFADGGPEGIAALRAELVKTGRALAALHQSGASYGRTATLEDELEEVREVIDRLASTVPQLELAAAALLQRLTDLSLEHPADPIVPAHHDFRPAQVLLHYGSLGFIDFDGASMAEPALDLGRFRAKLRDIGISSLLYTGAPLSGAPLAANLRLLDSLCEDFLSAYAEQAPVSRERVLLWETCDLLTGMLHAWTKVRLARLEPRLAVLMHQLHSSGLVADLPPAA
jgi:hypothetical protein